jgi:glycosyltransferase involved in cell wall biosynthesis
MISKACVVGTYQRKLEEIARLGIDLHVVVPPVWADPSGPQPLERLHTEGYNLHVLPLMFNGNYHLHWYRGLGALTRKIKPSVIHIDEEPYNLATWQALRLAKQARAKSLFFSWQNIARRYPPPFAQGEQWVLANIDQALMGTESAAEVWRGKGYRKPLHVIPQFGIDPITFAPADSVNTNKPVIGYFGRLIPEKGIDILLAAAAMLASDGLDFTVEIMGQGAEREALGALAAQLGLTARVSFLPHIASGQMPNAYRRLSVLVLASRTTPNWKEQFGRVLTEAMACGVPVVGADSGAIAGVIGEGGAVFPEGDSAALAAILRRLLKDSAYRQGLAKLGRARALANFTHGQVAAQTVAVYRALVGGS